jgi:hypothetical protein
VVTGSDEPSITFGESVVQALQAEAIVSEIASNKKLPFEKALLIIVGSKPALK